MALLDLDFFFFFFFAKKFFQNLPREMVFCSSCGNELPNDAKFCSGCGSVVAASAAASPATTTGAPANAGDLQTVTGAVRAYAADATTAEKEKRYGQQKFKLFETHSQRQEGITLDESLQRIENFSRHGVQVGHGIETTGSASADGATTTTSTTTSSSSAGRAGNQFGTGLGAGPAADAPRGVGLNPYATREVGGTAGQGTGSFGANSGPGARFLQGHQQREHQKRAVTEAKGGGK
jgi:zinc-ribbon domain